MSKSKYVRNSENVKAIGRRTKLDGRVKYDRSAVGDMSAARIKKLTQRLLKRKTFSIPYLFTAKQAKIEKSNGWGYELNAVMHLSPGDASGYQTCAGASPGCLEACLNTSGKGRLSGIQIARVRKTKLFFEHQELFGRLMDIELAYWTNKAEQDGMSFAARLNGTSDIQWEKVFPWMFEKYSEVQFYDYTKISRRFGKRHNLPSNYHLTFSRSESNQRATLRVLNNNGNVAMVFTDAAKALRDGHKGRACVDGVGSDRRYDDPDGVIVALKALGEAKHDTTGFVIHN